MYISISIKHHKLPKCEVKTKTKQTNKNKQDMYWHQQLYDTN